MSPDDFPQLVFTYPFDDRAEFEANARGYLGYAQVHVKDGMVYPVVFYDSVRLSQYVEDEFLNGKACVADVGMIVVPAVTLANMQAAVKQLAREGFFSRQGPPREAPNEDGSNQRPDQ